MAASRRILVEFKQLQIDPVDGLTLEMLQPDGLLLRAEVVGPDGTPYAGGKFTLDINVPASYPLLGAPNIRFLTPIFHTHVNELGQFDLDLLERTSPVWTIRLLCEHVRALLGKANPQINVDSHASCLFISDPTSYLAQARRWSQRHGGAPDGASWNFFPIPVERTQIQRIVVRTWTGKKRAFPVDDATTIAQLKYLITDVEGSPNHEINLIARGLLLLEDKTLEYYGLTDAATLTMACRSSLYDDADLLPFVYGPDAPQIVITVWQQVCSDGSIAVEATSLDGIVWVNLNTTQEAMLATVRSALIQIDPSANGRLRIVTSEGAALD